MHRRCAFVLLTLPVLALVSPISPATAVPMAASPGAASPSATPGTTSGHTGGQICGTDYCIEVTVEGTVHGNALTASGTVTAVPNDIDPVLRLQLDKLVVSTPIRTVLTTGSTHAGTADPVTTTAQATVPGSKCEPYLTTINASARLRSGDLIKGSFTGTGYFSDLGPCPGKTLYNLTEQIAPSTPEGGGRSVTVTNRTMTSNDGTRAYATTQVTMTGMALSPRILRAEIEHVSLNSYPADFNQGELYPVRNPVDVSLGSNVVLYSRTYGGLWTHGCFDYYNGALVDSRYSDGNLLKDIVAGEAFNHCA